MLKVNSDLLKKVYNPLFDALLQQDFEKIKQCTTKDSINSPNYLGLMPIHVAAESCSLEIIDFLIQFGGASNTLTRGTNWSALHFAIKSGSIEKTRYFLQSVKWLPIGPVATLDCIQLAIKNEDCAMLTFLLEQLKVSYAQAFEQALHSPNKCFTFLMENHYTAELGFQVIASILNQNKQHRFDDFLKKGVLKNAAATPVESLSELLQLAIAKGAPITVDSLLDYGAKLTANLVTEGERIKEVLQVIFAHQIIFTPEDVAKIKKAAPSVSDMLDAGQVISITIEEGKAENFNNQKVFIDCVATIARYVYKKVSNPSAVSAVLQPGSGIKEIALTLSSKDINAKNQSKVAPNMLGEEVLVKCQAKQGSGNNSSGVSDNLAAQLLGLVGTGGDNQPDIVFQFHSNK